MSTPSSATSSSTTASSTATSSNMEAPSNATIASDQPVRESLRVHPADNVCVALCDLPQGYRIGEGADSLTLVESVHHKHKFALEDLAVGDTVTMYGVTVGRATRRSPVAA